MVECAKKAAAIWNKYSDEQKAKWNQAHDEDVKRYQDQCEELKTNGFFILADGRKSCDVPVKIKRN